MQWNKWMNEWIQFFFFFSSSRCICFSKINILLFFYQLIFSIFPLCLLTFITCFRLSLHFLGPYLWLHTNIAKSCDFSLTFLASLCDIDTLSSFCFLFVFVFFFSSFFPFTCLEPSLISQEGYSSVSCCGAIRLTVTYNTAEGRRASLWLLGYRGTRSISEEFLHYD